MQQKLHIKVGDTVKVISGESNGQEGKILTIDRKKSRAIVEGVNLMKKHQKPSATDPQGGIVEKEVKHPHFQPHDCLRRSSFTYRT